MINLPASSTVLVTGGTGSLGRALLARLVGTVRELRVLSRDEAKQADLKAQYPSVAFMLGDVRDARACAKAVRGVDVVVHAASLKYVDESERQPTEYALTNVVGTINLLHAALAERTVKAVVGISTDKAAAPINTYGLTKGLLEKLFVEASQVPSLALGTEPTRFVVCRYGNVLGSRGSVVLRWAEARRRGETISVTDPAMTRFFFTVDDAVDLVGAALGARSGTIVSKAMPSTTVGALAAAMAQGSLSGIKVVGRRPGEKEHEDLLTAYEMPRVTRSREDPDVFHYRPLDAPRAYYEPPYTSDAARRLTNRELAELTAPWRCPSASPSSR